MTRTRPLLLSLTALLASAACGSKKSNKTPAEDTKTHALMVTSTPVRSAVVGEPLRYRVTSTVAGATVEATQLPARGRVEPSGVMTWTPTEDQAGEQKIALVVTAGGESTTQEFTVTAARARVEATEMVDPKSAVTQTVAVTAPLSRARNAAVQIQPGSLEEGAAQAITISSLENAPTPPAVRVAGVAAADVQPIEFGPSGIAFRKPVRVQLPVPEPVASRSRTKPPEVQTFDYGTGQWSKVPILSFDAVQRVIVAEVSHFSTYVATPPITLVQPDLRRAGAGTSCSDALIVRAPIVVPFSSIPSSMVNGYAGGAETVLSVLAKLATGQTLKVFTKADARGTGASVSGFLLAAATKNGDGTFKVVVTSDKNSAPFLNIPASISAGDAALEGFLNGTRSHFIFPGLAAGGSASAHVDVSFYVTAGADANRAPAQSVNSLAVEDVTANPLVVETSADSGFDADCDQAPNAFDSSPNDEPAPTLTGTPPSPLRVLVGGDARLAVKATTDDLTYTWTASDPALGLSGQGPSATVKPTLSGTFKVEVVAQKGATSTRFLWDVIADPVAVQTMNTPPILDVAVSSRVIRVGESATLSAVGKDREQPTLGYEWSTADGAVLSSTQDAKVAFSADKPGDYMVRCTASDGFALSNPVGVIISVIAATENRPPNAPNVTPLAALLTHEPGMPVSLTLSATADDPDGDKVSFEFAADPTVPRSVSMSREGAAATITTATDGALVFYVTARDAKGAAGPFTAVKLQVVSKVATDAVDADGDGFPVGADCDDTSKDIFPGRKEICGDKIDQDCDGRDRDVNECDMDGDRFSALDGDCDDRDSNRNPGAEERCDGVDNDCNGKSDDGFDLGRVCSAGEGVCQTEGKTVCNAAATGAVCNALRGAVGVEICDGKDNDCNGKVDDLAGDVRSEDLKNCGGCNLACPILKNSVAACELGGCASRCQVGFVDLDGSRDNGCECEITNKGVEICDGKDNDCNGRVDDGAAEIYYPGPGGTQGTGQCTEGVRSCKNGVLVVDKAPRLPAQEVCDGVDNDCNGKVDELESCRPANNPDAGVPPVGGADAGTTTPPTNGGGGPTIPALCRTATGSVTCTELSQDPANCGACGNVCAQGTVCNAGVCSAATRAVDAGTSPAGTETTKAGDCEGVYPADGVCHDEIPNTCTDGNGKMHCTNHTFDNANCGGCGITCKVGTVCQQGACSPPSAGCPLDRPAACNNVCTNTNKDPMNCGACGKACGAGLVCDFGRCVEQPTDTSNCIKPKLVCSTADKQQMYCTDPAFDPANCGSCGNACPLNYACKDGRCFANDTGTPVACTMPKILCKDAAGREYCADPVHEQYNCGACGVACGAEEHCDTGKCVPGAPLPPVTSCNLPQTLCKDPAGNLFCSDLSVDSRNCGTCLTGCPTDTHCEAGKCVNGTATPPVCQSPSMMCPDGKGGQACFDTRYDIGHCGRCDVVCAAGQTCDQGACVTPAQTCQSPLITCKDPAGKLYCADTTTDNYNCGNCGIVCNATSSCVRGQCTLSGSTGTGGATGAAGVTGTDPSAAAGATGTGGATGTASPVGTGGVTGAGGATGIVCMTNQIVCKDPNNNAFCTDVQFDRNNCGRCGNLCPTDQVCSAGLCVAAAVTCKDPLTACKDSSGAAVCTNILTDGANCGRCGNVCPDGKSCSAGLCTGLQ